THQSHSEYTMSQSERDTNQVSAPGEEFSTLPARIAFVLGLIAGGVLLLVLHAGWRESWGELIQGTIYGTGIGLGILCGMGVFKWAQARFEVQRLIRQAEQEGMRPGAAGVTASPANDPTQRSDR